MHTVSAYEWSRDEAAACDSLRLQLTAKGAFPETVRAEVFLDGVCVFRGYPDYQSEENGVVFLFARSSAALLVDNEAPPMTYQSPCAEALFLKNAAPLGFTSRLGRYYAEAPYTVGSGSSCYGAVNRFLRAFGGKNLAVSPDGALYLPDGKTPFPAEKERILRLKKITRRGGAVSRIDFKVNGEDNRHIKSTALEARGICRTRRMNLASVPAWQRDSILKTTLRDSAKSYETAELTLRGIAAPELYAPLTCDGLTGYRVTAFTVKGDRRGTTTRLVAAKELALGEVTYVAE